MMGTHEHGKTSTQIPGLAPIVVFFAMEAESGCLEDRLSGAKHLRAASFRLVSGTLAGTEMLVVQMGAGMKNARSAAETVIRTHNPRLVISAGFAGGLEKSLRKHDLLIPTEFATEAGDFLTVDSRISTRILPERTCLGGRLLTVNRVVTEPEEKREFAVRFQARALEMETFAIADVCRNIAVPFLSLRVISDPVDQPLPRDVQKLVGQNSMASRFGAALQLLASRPGSIKDLYSLYQGSIESSSRLVDALEVMIEADLFHYVSENFGVPRLETRLIEEKE